MSTQLVTFDDTQIATLKRTIAKEVPDPEFRLFLDFCKFSGLNPALRQVYPIMRGGKMTIQTGIDGFRVLAERSGKYEGQDGPYWCGPDGVWVDVWLKSEPPAAAKVGIYKKGFQTPLWRVALWSNFAPQPPSQMWQKMGAHMLAKVAEAQALRAAFPSLMSGIYGKEEMDQADEEIHPYTGQFIDALPHEEAPANPKNVVTLPVRSQDGVAMINPTQIQAIRRHCGNKNIPVPANVEKMTHEEAVQFMAKITGHEIKAPDLPVNTKTIADYQGMIPDILAALEVSERDHGRLMEEEPRIKQFNLTNWEKYTTSLKNGGVFAIYMKCFALEEQIGYFLSIKDIEHIFEKYFADACGEGGTLRGHEEDALFVVEHRPSEFVAASKEYMGTLEKKRPYSPF
jgi:phage recombination protein Bet